jgi:very-short-patch-repair endonuclease
MQSGAGISEATSRGERTFLNGSVAVGLTRVRNRLLDLTLRNRLLNYAFARNRVVRVVDELPNVLFELLRNGSELRFDPVPEPRGKPAGEASAAAPGAEKPSAAARAEAHARTMGINTSFELPRTPGNVADAAERHRDRAIQTVLFPSDLESTLRKLATAARTSIEETGSNTLFLTFGFLEWAESVDSQKLLLAPLVLLPVSLTRGEPDAKTRMYRYTVRYSGEDLTTNLSLQEKLKHDFQLAIPDITEDTTPEEYMDTIEELVRAFPRWRVRREVVLNILSFGKMVLYADLDPKRWRPGGGPLQHPIARQLFEGSERDGGAVAREYYLDDLARRSALPPVILDADSSQHSAIVDAMQGKNLVIEGPPGTGKSQTIANIIGAALVAGKSVLFVAEKLAALEVVRRRLDAVGLGLFCLELHSHKTQKTVLLDDIGERIGRRQTFSEPRALDEKLRLLDREKQRLSEHAKRVNTTFGGREVSIYDIFWGTIRRRQQLKDHCDALDTITFANAQDWRLEHFEDAKEAATAYASVAAQFAAQAGRMEEHPWYGIGRATAAYDEDRPLQAAVQSIAATASQLLEARTNLVHATGDQVPDTPDQLDAWAQRVEALAVPSAGAALDIAPRLERDETRRAVTSLCDAVERLRSALAQTGPKAAALARRDPATIVQALESARILQSQWADSTLQALHTTARQMRDVAGACSALSNGVEKVGHSLGLSVRPESRFVDLALATIRLAARAPMDHLPLRPPYAASVGTDHAVARACSEIQALREDQTRLAGAFDFQLLPDAATLLQYAGTCTTAGIFRWFDGSYRAAKACFLTSSIAEPRPKATKDTMAAAFRELASFGSRRAALDTSTEARAALGAGFAGMDTPIEAIAAAREWMVQVHTALGGQWPLLAERLATAPGEWVAYLSGLLAPMQQADAAWRALAQDAPSAIAGVSPSMPLAQLATYLEQQASCLVESATALLTWGVERDWTLGAIVKHLEVVLQLAALTAQVASDPTAQIVGQWFRSEQTDTKALRAAVEYADEITNAKVSAPLQRWLLSPEVVERLAWLQSSGRHIRQTTRALRESYARFEGLSELDARQWFGDDAAFGARSVGGIQARSARAVAAQGSLTTLLELNWRWKQINDLGLAPVVDEIVNARASLSLLWPAAEYVYFHNLSRAALRAHPELQEFSGATHEQVRDRFRALDRESIALGRDRAAFAIDSRTVPGGQGRGSPGTFTDLALLQQERSKRKRHVPIRNLMSRASGALQALKPCFMMGPLSVAQYLPPDQVSFDVVIMDEASQLRPEDALGAVLRGKQLIVVGDSNQLPPTNFFQATVDEEEIEEDDTSLMDGTESVLEIAASVFQPSRRLRWHYRSRHGSLIAFSNAFFYNNDLIVFPSPLERDLRYGVKLEYVADGVYAASGNQVEAARVVDAVLEHLRTSKESLGVVAMNREQRDIIEDLLDRRLKEDSELRARRDALGGAHEPFFIKNLENVQGDERDIIYISFTYGPARPGGPVAHRFGPINGRFGPRRLNVLFSRAKHRVVAFSSMRGDQLVAGEGAAAQGVRVLKEYLEFADTGKLAPAHVTGRPADSDFEVSVATAIRGLGYEVVPQLGVAGYFLDLAIRHPRKAEAFILAVECDGATYHSSFSARDRDRLRQQVLEELGWKIHRIWSTDWFRNARREVDRLAQRLESLATS